MSCEKIRLLTLLGLPMLSAAAVVFAEDAQINSEAMGYGEVLKWVAAAQKGKYYPGEPLLLVVKASNASSCPEKVDFGTHGITAFSMEICDANDIVVRKGEKIERSRFGPVGWITVGSGATGEKPLVLNRWCSTLLDPGEYQIHCFIDYKLWSEREIQGTSLWRWPEHRVELKAPFKIVEQDAAGFKKVLDELVACEQRKPAQDKAEWVEKRDMARQMLAFCESPLAVPYQLRLLRTSPVDTRDAIESLVRTGGPEAVRGLIAAYDDPDVSKWGLQYELLFAIYRLHTGGAPDVTPLTQEFVTAHEQDYGQFPWFKK